VIIALFEIKSSGSESHYIKKILLKFEKIFNDVHVEKN
jgi:hypothetical protein